MYIFNKKYTKQKIRGKKIHSENTVTNIYKLKSCYHIGNIKINVELLLLLLLSRISRVQLCATP